MIQILYLDLGRGFRFAGGFDGLLALARRQRLRWRRPSLDKAVLALEYNHFGQRGD
jgi:hypothetical protein